MKSKFPSSSFKICAHKQIRNLEFDDQLATHNHDIQAFLSIVTRITIGPTLMMRFCQIFSRPFLGWIDAKFSN